jgi:hypothetical protein
MIATSVRSTLSAGDQTLALGLLSGGREGERRALESRMESEGPDALWDDPRLVPALTAYRGLEAPSAALFLYAVLRRSLLDVGLDDRAVADYCAALVLVFGRGDRAFRIEEHEENRTAYLVDLVVEADRAEGERRFRVHMHLGDFALWMAGIFPDYIAARRARKGGPPLDYYEQVGSSGFLAASDHRLAGRYGLGEVLRLAGERFFDLRVALNRLSDGMMFPGCSSPDRLMRQVADGFRAGRVQ